MQSEVSISEEFEGYDDEKEFRRLVRAVKFSQKFYLYFVCCNQVPRQNELIADAKKALGGKKIKVVKFKEPITDLLTELQKKKFSKDCEAVFVQGLEYSISSDGKGDENALIHNLNISRDAFKKYLSCPMFLWLPEYAIVKITRHASDFFSVRSGTFYFSSTPEKVTEQIFQSFSSGWIEISSLPLTEKQKKIEMLENLLAEYKGLHKEKKSRQTEMWLLAELAEFFHSISEYRKVIGFYERALDISKEIGNHQSESSHLGSLGNAHRNIGEYRKAIEYYEQALKISKEIGDRQGEGKSLGNLGNIHLEKGEYRKAIGFYERALDISKEIGDRQSEGSDLGNLGSAYDHLGEYRKAIEYSEQALEITKEIGDCQGESVRLGNLGSAYDHLGEYRKAIEFYEQALKISKEIGDRQGKGSILSNLGVTYENLGEKEKACSLWKEALAIFEIIESPYANRVRQWIEENGC